MEVWFGFRIRSHDSLRHDRFCMTRKDYWLGGVYRYLDPFSFCIYFSSVKLNCKTWPQIQKSLHTPHFSGPWVQQQLFLSVVSFYLGFIMELCLVTTGSRWSFIASNQYYTCDYDLLGGKSTFLYENGVGYDLVNQFPGSGYLGRCNNVLFFEVLGKVSPPCQGMSNTS